MFYEYLDGAEYCRIVWDIFPEEKNIRFVVAGAQPELLNGWQVRQRRLSSSVVDPDSPKIEEKKIQLQIFLISFIDQKLQFTFPLASRKDVQTTGEAFSPQMRISSTSKNEIY
jgi:hypothetical protein